MGRLARTAPRLSLHYERPLRQPHARGGRGVDGMGRAGRGGVHAAVRRGERGTAARPAGCRRTSLPSATRSSSYRGASPIRRRIGTRCAWRSACASRPRGRSAARSCTRPAAGRRRASGTATALTPRKPSHRPRRRARPLNTGGGSAPRVHAQRRAPLARLPETPRRAAALAACRRAPPPSRTTRPLLAHPRLQLELRTSLPLYRRSVAVSPQSEQVPRGGGQLLRGAAPARTLRFPAERSPAERPSREEPAERGRAERGRAERGQAAETEA